ncbi:hypothetical protein J6590_011381 [Homalodisca vitripennis]|nr:hypothetical protein J6590_011381 [Homalodisca vitripennis]
MFYQECTNGGQRTDFKRALLCRKQRQDYADEEFYIMQEEGIPATTGHSKGITVQLLIRQTEADELCKQQHWHSEKIQLKASNMGARGGGGKPPSRDQFCGLQRKLCFIPYSVSRQCS